MTRRLAFLGGAPAMSQYVREAMNRDISAWLACVGVAHLDAVEVSGRNRADLGWKSYTWLEYPAFDLLHSEAPGQFDVVICEQVLEHVTDPDAAVRTLGRLMRPGGWLLVSTPFLIRIHAAPDDYWRFTPSGLRLLLERQGLAVDTVKSWGNRAAVSSNLRRWSRYHAWRSLRNEPELPVVVWALARWPA
jgi:2-polyprenyl-3-methyl-5-hydroxy-6-metoxy-1,4-benzoquinol methylase